MVGTGVGFDRVSERVLRGMRSVARGVVERLREELMKVRFADPGRSVQGRDEGLVRPRRRHVVAHRVREKVHGGVLAVEVGGEVGADALARALAAEGAVGAAGDPGRGE